jgi:hypothetical protein
MDPVALRETKFELLASLSSEHQRTGRRLLALAPKCAICGKWNSTNVSLDDCKSCRLVSYCSPQHREQDRKHHNQHCEELSKALACDTLLQEIVKKHAYPPAYVGVELETSYRKLPAGNNVLFPG